MDGVGIDQIPPVGSIELRSDLRKPPDRHPAGSEVESMTKYVSAGMCIGGAVLGLLIGSRIWHLGNAW